MSLRWPALLLIAGIALSGVVGTWQGYPLNQLWRWLAALWLAALLFEYVATRMVKLRVTLTQLTTPYLGRTGAWRYALRNLQAARLQLGFRPFAPASFTGELEDVRCTLSGQAESILEFEQTPTFLGQHPWPEQPIEIRGPLGLANWIRYFAPVSTDNAAFVSRIEPDVLESARDRIALGQMGSRAVFQRAIGGSEFRSLRSYSPGDPPASIYWKATAKTSKLMVRETMAEQQLLLFFLIDCGARSALQNGSLNSLAHAVNVSARMSELADRAGDRYGLLAYADAPIVQIPAGRGPGHLRNVRHALGELGCSTAESNPLDAVLAIKRLIPQRALVLLVTSLDDADVASQLLQATSMLRPQHLPMIVSVEDDGIALQSQARSSDTEGLYTVLAAREYRRTAARTTAMLERMGAIVVEAPPQQLEQMVFERYRELRAENRV